MDMNPHHNDRSRRLDFSTPRAFLPSSTAFASNVSILRAFAFSAFVFSGLVFSGLAFSGLVLSAHAQEKIALKVGTRTVEAEVAATESEQEKGLMYRTALKQNAGMLFVFPQPKTVCMWMRNTLIPLSVAFIDDRGEIVNIEDMEPLTTDIHCSATPVRFALEMNRGWFGQTQDPSLRITGLPKAERQN